MLCSLIGLCMALSLFLILFKSGKQSHSLFSLCKLSYSYSFSCSCSCSCSFSFSLWVGLPNLITQIRYKYYTNSNSMSAPKEKKQQFMRFGQIVRIHGHRLADEKEDDKEVRRGMIVAKGFTDPDAKYQTFNTFRNCKFYRQALFQVLPKGIFDESGDKLSPEDKKKLIQNYEELIKLKTGEIIKFGEEVVFKHVDSQEYLSGSVRCSKGGLGAFKVQLTHLLHKDLIFKMYPFRSFEKEGDKIKLESPLRIKNMENRCYISTQKNREDEAQATSESPMKKQKKMVPDNKDQKFNIVTTYSQSYTWLFHLHQSHETLNDTDQIRTHDIILLTYTKNDGYLCLDKTEEDKNLRAMVRLPLEQTGYPCYTCLWQIEKQPIPEISPYPDKKRGTDGTYTLRDLLTGEYLKVLPIQKDTVKKDFSIKPSDLSRLDEDEITIKSAKGMNNPADFIKHNGLVKIGGPKKTTYIKGEIDVEEQSQSKSPPTFSFREKSPYQLKKVVFLIGEGEHGFRIEKIDENSKREVLFMLSTYQVLDEFSKQLESDIQTFQRNVKAKRFYFIDSILQRLIAFIKDCDINEIEQDTLPNRKKQFIAKDLKICEKLFKIVEEMGFKILQQIYKKEKAENDAFKTVFQRAYNLILQIIKNNPITKLYVCEDWLNIILNHAIENEQQIVHETLYEILQSNELVVSKFLRADNAHLILRIINVFSLKPPHEKFLNIFRASCMSNGSPIVNNQRLILVQFFQKLDRHAQFTFIKPRASYGMSMDISLDPKKLYLECSISKDQNRIRTVKDFFEQSSKLDLSQTSNYFIAYLNLLADICYGRNTEAKKYVQKILSPKIQDSFNSGEKVDTLSHDQFDGTRENYDALYTLNYILQDKEMDQIKGYKNLLRAVLRLINYAFVESADQNPVLRINRYRNIDDMWREKQGEKEKFTRLKNVMDFVKQKLQGFKSFYQKPERMEIKEGITEAQRIELLRRMKKQQQISSIQDKQFLLTELVLLKSTLIIGYWTVQQQQKLVPILLKVLTNSKKNILHFQEQEAGIKERELQQIKLFKQEARRHTPNAELITSCKALVCELIQIIFDFRHDDLVTKCVSIYKEMEQKFKGGNLGHHNIVFDEDLEIEGQANKESGPELYNINQWKHRLAGIFDQGNDDQKDMGENNNKIIVPLMVELGIHQDPNLFFRSLLIMKRHFEYRVDILKLFLNLSIYDSETGEYLSQQIASKRKELNTLQQQNLLYIDQPNVYDNIMAFLVWLSEAIKSNFNLEKRPDYKDFRCIFDHFHERSQIDEFRQRTIKNKDLHPVLLKFIGLSRQSLQTYTKYARNVLKYVYRFLTLLCKGFLQAKLQIYHKDRIISIIKDQIKQEVTLLQPYSLSKSEMKSIAAVKRRDDCEAIQLLAELFSHNKTILFNEQEIQQTCEAICEYVNEVSINNYYKSHLLDFCRSLIYYKDQQITINQSRVLAKLQDPKKQNIYYREKGIEDNNNNNSNNNKQQRQQQKQRQIQSSEVANQSLTNYIIKLVHQFSMINSELKELKEPGEFGHGLEREEKRDLILGPELTYFVTLFNLFANLVQGKHIVNIGKGRQVHSYQMLMEILKSCDLCYPLKTNIRNYINQLYYSTPIQQDLYNQIIKQELPQLILDLNDIITILVKPSQPFTYELAHPIRYRFYDTYLFLYIEQILFSLNYLFCQPQSEFFRGELQKQLAVNYSKGYYYLHYFIVRIYERLRWVTEYYYKHSYIRGMLNMISNRMRIDYLEKFKLSAFRIFDRDEEKGHDPANYDPTVVQQKQQMTQRRQEELMNRCSIYLHKLVKGQIGNFFVVRRERDEKNQNFPLTFILPYEEKQSPENTLAATKKQRQMQLLAQKLKFMLLPSVKEAKAKIDHHLRLQTISDRLWGNVSFINFINNYLIQNCKELYKIDDYSRKMYNFQTPFVSFQEYIKIFVQVNSEKPESIPNHLRIFFFQVILEYIKQERTGYIMRNQQLSLAQKDEEISKPIDRWGKEDWKDVEKQVQSNQQFLVDSQVAELIIQSLKNAQDIDLYNAILKFSIAYLLGGYKNSQDSIYQKLKQDQKNNVFIKLEKLIARLGKKITSRIAERTNRVIPPQDQFLMNALDQYDYYDSQIRGMKKFQSMNLQDKQENEEELLEKEVFSMIFKFLQLLCECNHVELKNFVREQTNVNGEKKNYSFSLINVAIFEIRRLFKVMNKQASTIILPLVDFVNQVVTIPCLQNQKSLSETTFFEDLCYMASFFSEKGNIIQRGFDQPKSFQLLNNIYKQCILIILNVLESNEPSLIRELLIKIKARFLLGIILRNLQSLKIRTPEDIQNILENKLMPQPKVPVKIEDTMNVMIVLEKLQDSEGSQKLIQQKQAYFAQINKGENPVNLKELLRTLRDQILKIQIVSISSGKKQFVYFPNHPILKTLSPTTRDRIMLNVSRSTQREKIRSLFNYKGEIIKQIQHNFTIQKQKLLGIIPYQPAKMLQLQDWAFYLSFLINIIWMVSSDVFIEYFEVSYYTPPYLKPILLVLDTCQFVITALYFVSYYKCQEQLAAFRYAKAKQQQAKEQERKLTALVEGVKEDEDGYEYTSKNNQTGVIKWIFSLPITIVNFIIWLFTTFVLDSSLGVLIRYDSKFLYILAYLLSSFFGLFYSQTIFLCYVLFFFMENDTLSNVFNAIVYNLRQLLSVGLLGIVFVYVFCLVFYETYALEMMKEAGSDACSSIYGCILDLYVSGTIGGSIDQFKPVRFFTDLIYFIFFGLLFGNIVSGIMIDTFAELRTKRDEMYDDKKNKCYICGKDRGMLQKNNEKFEDHIHEKHFLWNYIYYTYCLDSKHETEHSGLEYEIKECLKGEAGKEQNAIMWIPFNTEDEQGHTNKIIELESTMKQLTQTAKQKLKALKSQPNPEDEQNALNDEAEDDM